MITLRNVSRAVTDSRNGEQTVLRGLNVKLSERAFLGILTADIPAATLFLQLMCGSEKPDAGSVLARGVRFSPLVQAGGVAGACFVAQISCRENIRFLARLQGVDAAILTRLVDAACGLGPRLDEPMRHLSPPMRRAVEVSAIAALPYDCYLVDRFDLLQVELRWLLAQSARARSAGLIFSTNVLTVAQEFAVAGLALQDGTAMPLDLDEDTGADV